jgi:hypothetical protein
MDGDLERQIQAALDGYEMPDESSDKKLSCDSIDMNSMLAQIEDNLNTCDQEAKTSSYQNPEDGPPTQAPTDAHHSQKTNTAQGTENSDADGQRNSDPSQPSNLGKTYKFTVVGDSGANTRSEIKKFEESDAYKRMRKIRLATPLLEGESIEKYQFQTKDFDECLMAINKEVSKNVDIIHKNQAKIYHKSLSLNLITDDVKKRCAAPAKTKGLVADKMETHKKIHEFKKLETDVIKTKSYLMYFIQRLESIEANVDKTFESFVLKYKQHQHDKRAAAQDN